MALISKVVIRLYARFVKYRRKLCNWKWQKHARCFSFLNGGKLEIRSAVFMSVPVRCDGRGYVEIQEHVQLGYGKAPRIGTGEILLQARRPDSSIKIDRYTITSNNVTIIANDEISLGQHCLIGDGVSIFDSDFHAIEPEKRFGSHGAVSPVRIHDNVWVGSRVMILKGVEIGENSVIAAGSVVTTSIPANVLAAGIPARVIRELSPTILQADTL